VTNPTMLGSVDFSSTPSTSNPFHPEDLAISPTGRYVVVSDGYSYCTYRVNLGVASIDVTSRNLVQYLTLASPKQAQNVSVDNYGNVFVGDYCNRRLYLLRIDSNGALTDTGATFDFSYAPFNSYVSPDSSRLFVVGEGGITVFQINGAGSITKILESTTVGKIQSMAFSPDGTKVFLGDYSTSPDRIIVANTNNLTVITTVDILTDQTAGYFDVDVMSVEPNGQKLYMGNMADGTTRTNKVTVVNLDDYVLSTIDLASDSVPTALAFRGVYRFDLRLPLVLR